MPFFTNSSQTVQHYAVDDDLSVRSILVTDASGTEGARIAWSAADTLSVQCRVANDEIAIGTDTSTDLRLNGATAGRDALWDASANTLFIQDNAILNVGSGADFTITSDGTNVSSTAGGTFDFQGTGAVTIDSSAGAISIGGDAVAQAINIGTGAAARTVTIGNVTGATAIVLNSGTGGIDAPLATPITHSAGFLVPCYSTGVHQALSGAGAANLTSSLTRVTSTGADAVTLAAPGSAVPPGFIKRVELISDGGTCTLTVTGLAAANDVWTMDELGQSLTVMAINSTTWVVVATTAGDTVTDTFPGFA